MILGFGASLLPKKLYSYELNKLSLRAWQSHKIKDQGSKIKITGKNTKTLCPT